MKIHLVRHAEAVERSPEIAEEHRYLTPKGRTRFREVAAILTKTISPQLIITSPLVRAVQTADILAEQLGFSEELILSTEVGPGFDIETLKKIIERYRDVTDIALVGHEPDLGEVAGTLLGVADCSLTKGMTLSFKISSGGDAEFVQMVTGGGKLVKSRDQAVERLTKSS